MEGRWAGGEAHGADEGGSDARQMGNGFRRAQPMDDAQRCRTVVQKLSWAGEGMWEGFNGDNGPVVQWPLQSSSRHAEFVECGWD